MPKMKQDAYKLDRNVSIPLQLLHGSRTAQFTDLEANAGPYATLTEEEVKVLMDVALLAMSGLEQVPTRGTLRIYGQSGKRAPELIMTAHLKDGYEGNFLKLSDIYAGEIAEKVNDCLNGEVADVEGYPWYDEDNRLPENSGIYIFPYTACGRPFLFLRTTYGYFYVCLFCKMIYQDVYAVQVMWALGQALACLRPYDTTLWTEMEKCRMQIRVAAGDYQEPIAPEIFGTCRYREDLLLGVVAKMFKDCSLPSLHTWHNCHKISSTINKTMPLYFEQVLQ